MIIFSLWLPILLSAIAVFVASSIIHMLLGYHRGSYHKIPDEDTFLAKLQALELSAGEYMYPYAGDSAALNTQEFQDKMKNGPSGMLIAYPKGGYSMLKNLSWWFIYSLIVGCFTAYIAGIALPSDASYLKVMQLVGAVAFSGYGLALIQQSVWFSRPWSTTFKFLFDALIYGLVTGGVFGWLWI
ncbi:MAG: hypothetical protein Q9M92_03205 [Enterobacterales bacterium]|nr:hypothetical protein [Enterobacterales bacterium]